MAWLERTQLPLQPEPCPSPLALKVWNTCRGIDWIALPMLADLYGISDLDILIAELVVIREFQGALTDD